MKILVVNAGSSSLKYQLFDMDKNEVLANNILSTHHSALGKRSIYPLSIGYIPNSTRYINHIGLC